MTLPTNASELAIWALMQFPVLAVAVLLARSSVRYTERLHEKRIADARQANESLMAERDYRLRERDERIAGLLKENADLRAKLSRSRKPSDEGKAQEEGK